jgi:hypothetical protein
MLAAPAAPDTFEHDGIRLLDACNVECMGMQPSFTGGHVDPRTFFVGEDPAADLAELDNGKNNDLILPNIGDIMAGGSPSGAEPPAADPVGRGWESFPAIPEHAELHMQPAAMKSEAAFMSTRYVFKYHYYYVHFFRLHHGNSIAQRFTYVHLHSM